MSGRLELEQTDLAIGYPQGQLEDQAHHLSFPLWEMRKYRSRIDVVSRVLPISERVCNELDEGACPRLARLARRLGPLQTSNEGQLVGHLIHCGTCQFGFYSYLSQFAIQLIALCGIAGNFVLDH